MKFKLLAGILPVFLTIINVCQAQQSTDSAGFIPL